MRAIAMVAANGENVGEQMIESGLAVVWRLGPKARGTVGALVPLTPHLV